MTDRSGQHRWTYDQHGRELTQKQTTAGHIFTTERSYDAAGRLASLTYPSGAAVARSYDAAGRVGGLKSGTTALVGGVGYLPFGPATGWTQGNGAELQPHVRQGRADRRDRARQQRHDDS